jgi:small subunit ribosomal protein S1
MAEENKEAVENTENVQPQEEGQVQNSVENTENTQASAPAPQSEEAAPQPKAAAAQPTAPAHKGSKFTPSKGKRDLLVPSGGFDWAGGEDGLGVYSDNDRKKIDELYDKTLSSLSENQVVDGTVISVGKKEVVVNIGSKSEGVIPVADFRYNPDLKAGDKVPVYVIQQEDKNGQLLVSHKMARTQFAWDRVNEAMEKDEIVTGYVKCRTKGGLIVDVFGLEAFLPGSQIDVKPIRDYDQFVDKNMEFKVVKINHEFKNVVVSHKALIEAELEEQKKQIMQGLEKGQVLEGVVKNITTYGVFVDLGGVDGLIHITDLAWGRINHPEEVVTIDDKINVVILDFDDDKKRIALGLKQLTAHPWDAFNQDLKAGDVVKGKVVVLADYGAFIEIAPGVEGLVHVSEMSWSQHLRSAQDFLKAGDEVEAVVLNLDKEERKLSLGIKQLMPDPWSGITDKYKVAEKYSSTVRNFTPFGVFVELEEGIDGLIHISDLTWNKKLKHPSEFCNVGDKLEVVVLEIDTENRRLSLGHKQLEENPWDVFETVFTLGSVHQGTIVRKDGSQFVVALPYGLEGGCSARNLKKADGETANVDEVLEFKVLEFNKNARKIIVSHLHTHEAPTEKERKSTRGGSSEGGDVSDSALKAVQSKVEKSTLGDFAILTELKESMEKTAKAESDKAAKKAKKEEAAEEVTEAPAEEAPKKKASAKKKAEETPESDEANSEEQA